MFFFSKPTTGRTLIALLLLLCIVLCGGCISIDIIDQTPRPTQEYVQQPATLFAPPVSTIPYTEPSVQQTPITAPETLPVPTQAPTQEVVTEEEYFDIDWNSMTIKEPNGQVLTQEELEEMVEQNPQMSDLMEFIGPYAEFFGFAYDAEQDIFYSTKYPIQRIFGFNSLYDMGASRFGMFYQTKRIRFFHEDREWMVQLWKGQYGVTVGGEVGVYYRYSDSTFKHFDAVADEDMILMGFQLSKNNTPYLERGPEKHWWLTGFRILDVAAPTQLDMVIFFDWETKSMADAFEGGLRKILISDIKYKREGTQFYLTWQF